MCNIAKTRKLQIEERLKHYQTSLQLCALTSDPQISPPSLVLKLKFRSFTTMNSQSGLFHMNSHAETKMQMNFVDNEAWGWNWLKWRQHAYGPLKTANRSVKNYLPHPRTPGGQGYFKQTDWGHFSYLIAT